MNSISVEYCWESSLSTLELLKISISTSSPGVKGTEYRCLPREKPMGSMVTLYVVVTAIWKLASMTKAWRYTVNENSDLHGSFKAKASVEIFVWHKLNFFSSYNFILQRKSQSKNIIRRFPQYLYCLVG